MIGVDDNGKIQLQSKQVKEKPKSDEEDEKELDQNLIGKRQRSPS